MFCLPGKIRKLWLSQMSWSILVTVRKSTWAPAETQTKKMTICGLLIVSLHIQHCSLSTCKHKWLCNSFFQTVIAPCSCPFHFKMVAASGPFEEPSYRKNIEETGRLSRSRASVYKYKNDKLGEYQINSLVNPRQLSSWQNSPWDSAWYLKHIEIYTENREYWRGSLPEVFWSFSLHSMLNMQ